ncbi:MAG: hypothetical protein RLQ73_03020 [Hoeflea sp. D1-CHI-28]
MSDNMANIRLLIAIAFFVLGVGQGMAQTVTHVGGYRPGVTILVNADSCAQSLIWADMLAPPTQEQLDSEVFYYFLFDSALKIKEYFCVDGGGWKAAGRVDFMVAGSIVASRDFRWDDNRSQSAGRWVLGDFTPGDPAPATDERHAIFTEIHSIVIDLYLSQRDRTPETAPTVDPARFNADILRRWGDSGDPGLVYLASKLLPISDSLDDPATLTDPLSVNLLWRNCKFDDALSQRAADLGNPQAILERFECIPDMGFVLDGHQPLSFLPKEAQDRFFFHAAKSLHQGYLPAQLRFRHLLSSGVMERINPILVTLAEKGMTYTYEEHRNGSGDGAANLAPLEGQVQELVTQELLGALCNRGGYIESAMRSGSLWNMIIATGPGQAREINGWCQLDIMGGNIRLGYPRIENLQCRQDTGSYLCTFTYRIDCRYNSEFVASSEGRDPVCLAIRTLPNPGRGRFVPDGNGEYRMTEFSNQP